MKHLFRLIIVAVLLIGIGVINGCSSKEELDNGVIILDKEIEEKDIIVE